MSEVTSTAAFLRAAAEPGQAPPAFVASAEDAAVLRWGPVLSVFGGAIEKVLERVAAISPESGSLVEEVQCAARRYGAFLEVVCNSADVSTRPCTVYSCCDGISVLLIPQRAMTQHDSDDALVAFDSEKTSMDERVFISLLSQALLSFFDANVAESTGIVTVSVGSGDYCFMRASQRDSILQKLHVAVSADAY